MSATPISPSHLSHNHLAGQMGHAAVSPYAEPIVVATDHSTTDDFPLRYAQAIAREQHGDLILVHILDPLLCEPSVAPGPSANLTASETERLRLESTALAHVRTPQDRDVLLAEVLAAARRNGAKLLVIGAHGHTTESRAALARMARVLLLESPCAVLVVGQPLESSLSQAGRWRRVLVATDFSSSTLAALRQAHQLAHEELIALHCAACGNTDVCTKCLERLRMLAPFNESHTVPVRHIVECGEPGEAIVECAHKVHADLVVLGTPALAQTSPGDPSSSTLCQVIEGVDCPVLLIPQAGVPVSQEQIRHVVIA